MRRVAVVLMLLAVPARAGVYSPDEKCPFRIGPDGAAEPLSFDESGFGQYKLLMGRLADVGTVPVAPKPNSPARQQVLDRIAKLSADPATKQDPAKLAGLATDLLRTRQTDAALNLLAPRSRDRRPDFRVLATLAHAHAVRGEWADAIRTHTAARLDAAFPADLAGATAEQRAWLKRIEDTHYPRWLRVHRQEADARGPAADDDVFPLFDGPPPADAIAVVQQLLLWHPDDARLHWLLADRYAAAGQVRQAERIFDELVDFRQQSNRRKLVEQRAAVKRAVATLPAPTPEPPPPEPKEPTLADIGLTPEKMAVAGVVGGAAVLVLLGLQVRALRRRAGRHL